MRSAFRSLSIVSALVLSTGIARAEVILAGAKGKVEVRPPKAEGFTAAAKGSKLADGTRLRTGEGAEAILKYQDGSEATVREKSEIVVREANKKLERPNGLTLFIGRVWSKVAKSAGGEQAFEVRSANAVAGVRGTEFETGVALDGSALVHVSRGEVEVEGEKGDEDLGAGQMVETDESGGMGRVKKDENGPDWEGWFTEKARKMERAGLKIAKSMQGRLKRGMSKVDRLVAEQKELRTKIERLEKQKKGGADVDQELESTLAKLAKVTARLEDMAGRLEGAFGLFEEWGRASGEMGRNAPKIRAMASDVAKVAADFADMIEEGTDLSEEGMDDMMKDMGDGKMMGPGESAEDELLK